MHPLRAATAYLPTVLYPVFLVAGIASGWTPACSEMSFHAPADASYVRGLCLLLFVSYAVGLAVRRKVHRTTSVVLCIAVAAMLLAGCVGSVWSLGCDALEVAWPTLPSDGGMGAFSFASANAWKTKGIHWLSIGCAGALLAWWTGLHRRPAR
jgi:hypothetical protein